MPPAAGRRLDLAPRQRLEASSAPKRLLPTSARSTARLLGRSRTRARHRAEVSPPPRDFRHALHAHPRMSARPRALDPLFTDRASSPSCRSSTSAFGRSASTHLRTSTPDDRPRAARLTPRHTESAIGAPDTRFRRRCQRRAYGASAVGPRQVQGQPRDSRRALRLLAAMARGKSFTPTELGPDTFCRTSRAHNDGDVAARYGRASKSTNKFVDLPR